MNERVLKSSCWECFNHCGVLVHISNGRVVKVEGDPEHPYNRGFLCIKGRHAIDNLYHPDRVLYPLRRVKGGWERISWDEALDTIVDKLQEVREKYGPLSICGAGPHTDAYLAAVSLCLFLRSIGSPNMMSNLDLCYGSIQVADQLTVGDGETLLRAAGGAAGGPVDFQNSNCLFVLGGQIESSWPSQWQSFVEAKKRGAKVIVVDPRYTKTASQADLYLQIKPGTDAALALGMINIIINEELYDKEFVDKWCIGFDKLAERVQEYTPEKVERITWIPAEKIREATRIYARTKPACMSPRTGTIHHTNGVQTARAFGCVVALTGNIDILGGNPLAKPLKGYTSHGSILRSKEFRLPREIEEKALGVGQFPLWTGPDAKMVGVIHNPTALDAMITGKPYPVKAMLTTGVNILSTYPDSRKVLEALKRLEFLVVNAWFMTPTAEFADIILPKAHALETNEIAVYTGMHKCITICQKAVELQGEAWEDMKIYTELAKKMKQKGFIERSFLPWENAEDYLQYLLRNTGVTLEKIKQDGTILVPQVWKKFEKQGFPTPSGKVELYSSTLEKLGHDPLPDYKELPESDISTPRLAERYPLMLVTARRLAFSHSRFPVFSWAREMYPDPEVEIHPETAKERGIRNGDWVWIETPRGRCKHKAMVTDKVHPKVINPTVGWWFPEMPPPEHGCFEANVNAILSYDPPHDPIIGIPTVMGVLCEVTKMKFIS